MRFEMEALELRKDEEN